MAGEATVMSSLQLRKGKVNWRTPNSSFRATIVGNAKGPVPGAITVPTSGINIDLSGLTTPGLCEITNYDASNYVEYGIRDPDSGRFFPIHEILPGETYVVRLSRNLRQEYTGTGTGTGPANNTFHFKANGDDCDVFIGAFES